MQRLGWGRIFHWSCAPVGLCVRVPQGGILSLVASVAIDQEVLYDAGGVPTRHDVGGRAGCVYCALRFQHSQDGIHDGVLAIVLREAEVRTPCRVPQEREKRSHQDVGRRRAPSCATLALEIPIGAHPLHHS
jgi:hypothetical protein